MEANTEREWLVKFEGKLDLFNEKINTLSESIDNFSNTLRYLEDKKIASMQEKIDRLTSWRERMRGAWAAVVVISSVGAWLIGLAIKAL